MSSHGDRILQEFVAYFEGRPGWRLEPSTSPGAPPLWCFVAGGKVECSVTVAGGAIRLYEMETDREVVFADVAALTAWLQVHRAAALEEAPSPAAIRAKRRRFFEWS
jgi:hypothetical protein